MFSQLQKSYKIVLGSSSPRRQELLARLGLDFEIVKPQFEEKALEGEAPNAYAERNALGKAKAVFSVLDSQESSLVLSADTFVILEDEILEKPRDLQHARSMLKSLSGTTHRVTTSVCLKWGEADQDQVLWLCHSEVLFKSLSNAEIEYYLSTKEWCDKAGGYAIQGYGSFMVESVQGSFTNVIGLPLSEVVEQLKLIKLK